MDDTCIPEVYRWLFRDSADSLFHSLPHLLLYGPPGSGKTYTALGLTRHLYGEDVHQWVIWVNGSHKNGRVTIQDSIVPFMKRAYDRSKHPWKMVVFDEVDHLRIEAQNYLRTLIEEYTESVRFCFLCNDCDRIVPAILSRCTQCRFQPLPTSVLSKMMRELTPIHPTLEKNYPSIYNDISAFAKGDLRQCLVLCRLISTFNSVDDVLQCLHQCDVPRVQIQRIVKTIFEPNHEEGWKQTNLLLTESISDGYVYSNVMDSISDESVRMLMSKKQPETDESISKMEDIIETCFHSLKHVALMGVEPITEATWFSFQTNP